MQVNILPEYSIGVYAAIAINRYFEGLFTPHIGNFIRRTRRETLFLF